MVIPIVDLPLIAALCAGLALLPGVGWVPAALIMSLPITRTSVAITRDPRGDPGYRLSSVKVDSTGTAARSVLRTTQ